MQLDRIDSQILAALQNDARLSNKELAARVGLAPSSCLERVRRLRAAGVLRGFRADVDPAALGIRLQAMIAVRLGRHRREAFDAVRARLLERPEVLSVFELAGVDDLLVHVAVRDAEHLRELTWSSISELPDVQHLETSLIFAHARSASLPDYLKHE